MVRPPDDVVSGVHLLMVDTQLLREQWIEKLRAVGVTSVSIEIEPQQPDQHVVRAWNPKWLGGAAGTGRAATDVEAAARCWVAVRGPSWPSHK